jgi:hypothetical protein
MEGTMTALSAKEQHTLQHLRRAEEFGTSLEYYASAYELDLEQLRSIQAQLERKGFWPIKAAAPKALTEKRTELLAVQVVPEPCPAAEAAKASNVPDGEPLRCRLTAPSGWVIECDRWPAVQWLAALMGGAA